MLRRHPRGAVVGAAIAHHRERALVLARLDRSPYDWAALQPSKTTVGLTFLGGWSRTQPLSLSPIATPAHTGERTQNGTAGVQGMYSSFLHNDFLTTTRSAVTYTSTRTSPYLALPNANVLDFLVLRRRHRRASARCNSAAMACRTAPLRRWKWETTHETQFYAEDRRRSLHRFKLSADAMFDRYDDALATNDLGTFSYLSIADVQAGRPSAYTRTLATAERRGGGWNAYAALGDLWRVTPSPSSAVRRAARGQPLHHWAGAQPGAGVGIRGDQ